MIRLKSETLAASNSILTLLAQAMPAIHEGEWEGAGSISADFRECIIDLGDDAFARGNAPKFRAPQS
jgi:hypothetical protein